MCKFVVLLLYRSIQECRMFVQKLLKINCSLWDCIVVCSLLRLIMVQSYGQKCRVTIPRYRYFKTYFFYQLYV
jgi:hypothetical protein